MTQDSPSPTREPQYASMVALRERQGLARLGLMSSETWHEDPIRLAFLLSRYKFVARMFAGLDKVLEVGCADAFGTRIVQQTVGQVVAVDFDPLFVEDVEARMDREHWPLDVRVHDLLDGPVDVAADGAFALDVLEHIPTEHEDRFMANLCASLKPEGAAILGCPSLASQIHATPRSRAGHVNCKEGPALKALGLRHFHHAFVFSMNDEVVHTGFQPMAHYYLMLLTGVRAPEGGGGEISHA